MNPFAQKPKQNNLFNNNNQPSPLNKVNANDVNNSNPFKANQIQNNTSQYITPQQLNERLQNITKHFANQLNKKDTKINDLEFEIKTLKNSVNMLTTVVNQIKINQVHKAQEGNQIKKEQPNLQRVNQNLFTRPSSEKSQQQQQQKTVVPPLFSAPNNNMNFNSNNNQPTVVSILSKLARKEATGNNIPNLVKFVDRQYSTIVNTEVSSTSLQNFTIRNLDGQIAFTQNVDLTKLKNKRLSEFIQITNANVCVNEPELKNKMCYVTLYDFQNFSRSGVDVKQIIVDNLTSLTNNSGNKFSEINFDYQTGRLSLMCKGF